MLDIVNNFFMKKHFFYIMLLKTIGNNIRFLRKQAGLSQIDLAVAVGIDRSYLSEIENGHTNLTIMLLNNFATVLNVSLEELFKPLN